MAKTNDTPTLFRRLRELRRTVKAVRAELKTLHDSMNRRSKADPKTGWEEAEDLHIQLGNALADLDSALDYMKPMSGHIDQPARKVQEVAHGQA